jgi:hypothetical protein
MRRSRGGSDSPRLFVRRFPLRKGADLCGVSQSGRDIHKNHGAFTSPSQPVHKVEPEKC